jgi:hypothetical protein
MVRPSVVIAVALAALALVLALRRRVMGAEPEWFVGAMVEVMEHTRTGAAAHVTSAISDLTARPPRTYDEFAREFANVFAGA